MPSRELCSESYRDHDLFFALLNTGLGISELLGLQLSQYHGERFRDVKRKGNRVSNLVFLPKEARAALERYLELSASSTPWNRRATRAATTFAATSGRPTPTRNERLKNCFAGLF